MDRLTAGQQLNVGDELTPSNGRVRLVMQVDGNLVLYRTDDGAPLWASDTWQQPVTQASMQEDGNFVLYSDDGKPYWATNTDGHPGSWIVVQDDGNVVVYDNAGSALWASDTVQRFGPVAVPNYRPSTNAPLFGNGPWPTGTALNISVAGLPVASVDATKMGLCGGMSFLTRDIFESGTPQLRGRSSDRIPIALAQHILDRLIQSFGGPAVVAQWVALTQALDHDTVLWGDGLFRRSLREVPGILDDVDAGVLCPIGLVLVHSYAPWDVFQNHVVLVWGYERHGDILTLRTYDCNFPNNDGIVIQLDISSPAPAKTITTNGTHGPNPGEVRGFFRLPYAHADPGPAYIDDASLTVPAFPLTPLGSGARATVTVAAQNTGSTTWTTRGAYRLGSQAPQDNTTWGLARVELPTSSVDPGGTAAFHFDVVAPATADRYTFCWQMLQEAIHWFGHESPRLLVDIGSTTGACEQLHQRHGALNQQLQEVKDEIAGIDWSDPYIARREAARLNNRARALQTQIDSVERDQKTHGCAPT